MVEVNENQAPDVEMNANVSADPAPDAPVDHTGQGHQQRPAHEEGEEEAEEVGVGRGCRGPRWGQEEEQKEGMV